MAALRMHHPVHALAINDEPNADARADGNVAKRLFHGLISLGLSLLKFKHGWHVHIRVEEHTLAAGLRSEAQSLDQALQHGEVLPGLLGS